MLEPKWLLSIGALLMLIGLALPVLMIMQYIPSTFLLNFVSYAASFLGLMMGMVGSMFLVVRSRNRRNRDDR